MLCLIPLAWFSFNVLDLGAAITGGLFIGIGDGIDTLATMIPPSWGFLQGFIPFIVQGLLGIIALLYFPLHWALYYRPDEIGMAMAIVLPWLLVGTITSALFCKKARQGFDTGLAIGLAYALLVGVFPLILSAILNAALGGTIDIMSIINSLFSGMTDLPYWAAVVTACVEGGLIAGVFGALIGSLKYKPEGQLETQKVKKARKKKKEPKIAVAADTSGSSSPMDQLGMFCPNCRSKVVPGDPFCPNCGTKL
jgi:hypothetical protein